jgi:hypothetical protein
MFLRAFIVSIVVCVAAPATAQSDAQSGKMGADLDWGLVVPYPNTMVVNHQIYDLSINGIEDMCRDQPFLCRMKVQQDALAKLEHDRALGFTLTGVGFGLAVIGPVASIAANCGNATNRCEPNWAAFGTTLIGGSLLGILGLNIIPHQNDLVDFVHLTNGINPTQPVRLRIGMLNGSSPGLVIAGGF